MRSFPFAAALLLVAPAALAHAFLLSADPAAGNTVPAAPHEVRITFTEGVEPGFSTIAVTDAAGHRVDQGGIQPVAGSDRVLAVGLGALPAGTYKVVWHATAVDTHKTEGSFTFTVVPR
jgi:methionine-rich copper-binding protein CopC